MGVFVFLPLVLPLSAWPVARLAELHLHPRTATRLLTAVATVMALCSTLCLALLMVVGTAQLPGNPLPDGWSDAEVRATVPKRRRSVRPPCGLRAKRISAAATTATATITIKAMMRPVDMGAFRGSRPDGPVRGPGCPEPRTQTNPPPAPRRNPLANQGPRLPTMTAMNWTIAPEPFDSSVAAALWRAYYTEVSDRWYLLHEGHPTDPEELERSCALFDPDGSLVANAP
ncbi:hypothetical protein ABT086_42585, partial [Streptomyces mirabilis]